MVNPKKNFGKKPAPKYNKNVPPVAAEPEEQNAYDSMIEKGSSEESDGDAQFENETHESDSGEDSDDGFSEREESEAEKSNKATKAATKRKPDVETAAKKASSKKQKGVEKVKPPTLEEINELKETRNLFHSNLFRLQVKEMLVELKIKQKYTNYVSQWLEQFKLFLHKLESEPEKQDIDQLQWLKQSKLQVPLALQQLRVKEQKMFQFQFVKPSVPPFLIGAAATTTLLGPKLVADVCVVMPAECFQKENYLNMVYDQKRAYYLTYMVEQMLQSKFFIGLNADHLKFSYYENNPLKPVLELTPPSAAGTVAHKLCLRIFVAAEENSFKLSRFVPWNNNIRASLYGATDEDTLPPATPNYNANVLFDLTMQRNEQMLQAVFDLHKNFQEGLVLLKVWLRQRQLNVGYSGFHAHILAMFVAYLSKERKLHNNMSSYQVARTVWNQLAFSAWDEAEKGISLCASDSPTASNQPTLQHFHTHYDVVFVDATGFFNICSNLSLEMYRRVRMEAKLAVDMLNDMQLNSFQHLFMTKCPLYTQFDHILKINKADAIEQILELHVSPADKYNYAGYAYPQLLKVVTSLLRKGLGQRVQTLLPIERATSAWCCQGTPSSCAEELHIGFVLHPDHAFEVLEKGPESIAEGAAEFRRFWGDKAELRRFQDGSITESVVWAATTDTLSEKRLIVRSIVLHLLQLHFQLEPTDVHYVAGELDVVFRLTPAFKTDKLQQHQKLQLPKHADAEAVSLQVIRCFDDLARRLHGLSELPLEIVSIAGISPVFRYCEPTPLLPQARCMQEQFYATHVQHGVMQLGLSGKWPNELSALRALKCAFYIQIAKLLHEKHRLRTQVTYDGVLVLKQGHCFAIELAHPKEVTLLKRETTDRGITQYVDCAASIALERRHYILPKVSSALHALYQLHPSFGGTVMIAKRWLYSQLIDDGLWPDECTELLIAAQYLQTQAPLVTCSPQTGFMRFLQLLAHTDWQSELFVVNFNNAMDEHELSALEQRFNAARDTFPPLCIATAYDLTHYGQLWSNQQQPNVHVLVRVTILAREALAIMEQALLSSTDAFIKPSRLLSASNEGYDLLIQLKPDLVPNTQAYEFGSPFAPLSKPNWRLPLAGTNHLRTAVQQLREAYSDFAAFFYNPCGGKEIAVIWKPQIFTAKEFKVNDVAGCALHASGNKVHCQRETLIEDFKFILKDFYLRIDTVEAVLRASREAAAQAAKVQPKKGAKRYFDKADLAKTTAAQQKLLGNKKQLRQFKQNLAVKTNGNKTFNKSFKPRNAPKAKAAVKVLGQKPKKTK